MVAGAATGRDSDFGLVCDRFWHPDDLFGRVITLVMGSDQDRLKTPILAPNDSHEIEERPSA
jgi:hypothetical protein